MKRCRSVDPETGGRTRNISKQYQQNVQEYVTWARGKEKEGVFLFGDDVFNNIYCLKDRCIVPEPDCRSALVKDPRTGQFVVDKKVYKQKMEDAIERAKQSPAAFGEYLPGIEPGQLDADGNLSKGATMPEGWDEGGPEKAKRIIELGKKQVQEFLSMPPTPKAQTYISGMSAMVGIPILSGIAQNLIIVSQKVEEIAGTEVKQGSEIVSAASLPPIKAMLEQLTDVDIEALIARAFKPVPPKPEGGGEYIPDSEKDKERFGQYAGTAQTIRKLTDA